jgi:hypothetical protein
MEDAHFVIPIHAMTSVPSVARAYGLVQLLLQKPDQEHLSSIRNESGVRGLIPY